MTPGYPIPEIPPIDDKSSLVVAAEEDLDNSSNPSLDKAASLAIAVEILTALDSAADIFPPLKAVTSCALYIAKTAEVGSVFGWYRTGS